MIITDANAETGVVTFLVDEIGKFTYTVDFAEQRDMRAYRFAKAMRRLKNDTLADTDIGALEQWPTFTERMRRK